MSVVTVAEVRPGDIYFVTQNLWARGQEEAQLFGHVNRDGVMRDMIAAAKDFGHTILLDDEPVAVICALAIGTEFHTHFVATERFTEVGRRSTFILRDMVRREAAARPGNVIKLISATRNKDAPRWFELMGFVLEERTGFFSRWLYKRKPVDAKL